MEHELDSLKLDIFGAIFKPFSFMDKTVTGIAYIDMIQLWLFPQLKEHSNNFVFQKDGAPPRLLHLVNVQVKN